MACVTYHVLWGLGRMWRAVKSLTFHISRLSPGDYFINIFGANFCVCFLGIFILHSKSVYLVVSNYRSSRIPVIQKLFKGIDYSRVKDL